MLGGVDVHAEKLIVVDDVEVVHLFAKDEGLDGSLFHSGEDKRVVVEHRRHWSIQGAGVRGDDSHYVTNSEAVRFAHGDGQLVGDVIVESIDRQRIYAGNEVAGDPHCIEVDLL